MARVLRFLLLVPIGYAGACLVAAVVASLPAFGVMSFLPTLFLASILVGAWSFGLILVPVALFFVVAAEIMRLRSLTYWMVAGVLTALTLFIPGFGLWADLLGELRLVPTNLSAFGALTPTNGLVAMVVVAGLAGGVAFWSIAGRYAGARGRVPDVATSSG